MDINARKQKTRPREETQLAFTLISPPQLPGFIDQTPGLGLPRGSLRLGPGVETIKLAIRSALLSYVFEVYVLLSRVTDPRHLALIGMPPADLLEAVCNAWEKAGLDVVCEGQRK